MMVMSFDSIITKLNLRKRQMTSKLTEKELRICRDLFSRFDADRKIQSLLVLACWTGNGTIDVLEIKSALTAIGQQTSEEDLFLILSEVANSGLESELSGAVIRQMQITVESLNLMNL